MKKVLRVFTLWGRSCQALFSAPKVWIPLLVLGVIHLTLLYVLYLFPRPPIKAVLGPIVLKRFGEAYLHYPFNFIVLPYMVKITRQLLTVFVDFYFLAVFVSLADSFWRKSSLELKQAFTDPLRKLVPLLTYSVLIIIVVFALRKVPPYIFNYIYGKNMVTQEQVNFARLVNNVLMYVMEFFTVIIKTFFAFTIPYLILEGRGLLYSIDRSFQLALRNFFTTFFLVLLPAGLIFGLEQYVKAPQPIIENFYPEMVFHLLLGTEIINVLFCFLLIFPLIGIYRWSESASEA